MKNIIKISGLLISSIFVASCASSKIDTFEVNETKYEEALNNFDTINYTLNVNTITSIYFTDGSCSTLVATGTLTVNNNMIKSESTINNEITTTYYYLKEENNYYTYTLNSEIYEYVKSTIEEETYKTNRNQNFKKTLTGLYNKFTFLNNKYTLVKLDKSDYIYEPIKLKFTNDKLVEFNYHKSMNTSSSTILEDTEINIEYKDVDIELPKASS